MCMRERASEQKEKGLAMLLQVTTRCAAKSQCYEKPSGGLSQGIVDSDYDPLTT